VAIKKISFWSITFFKKDTHVFGYPAQGLLRPGVDYVRLCNHRF